jgi:hypothetical protein
MTLIVLSFLEQAVTVDSTRLWTSKPCAGPHESLHQAGAPAVGVQDGGDAASNDGLMRAEPILAPDRRSARCASAKPR